MSPKRPPAEWNCLEASVVGEEFVGATAVVHLEASDRIEIKAQKSHDELDRLNLEPGPDLGVMAPGGITYPAWRKLSTLLFAKFGR
ncbi:hypothetical protein [Rhizobium grahamii]|uniref:hypothetical protein n=1 Tax=Rhizobium grahamii TaxID=1120045 RepID=UPI003144E426